MGVQISLRIANPVKVLHQMTANSVFKKLKPGDKQDQSKAGKKESILIDIAGFFSLKSILKHQKINQ